MECACVVAAWRAVGCVWWSWGAPRLTLTVEALPRGVDYGQVIAGASPYHQVEGTPLLDLTHAKNPHTHTHERTHTRTHTSTTFTPPMMHLCDHRKAITKIH